MAEFQKNRIIFEHKCSIWSIEKLIIDTILNDACLKKNNSKQNPFIKGSFPITYRPIR